jgi:uncharacterized protein YlxP (DUF503 family)
MVVGICRVELYLPGNGSLKEKRSRLKPLLTHLRREFNLAAAEIDLNDVWRSAAIGMATISNDAGQAHSVLEKAVHWVEHRHPGIQVVDWEIEVL